MLIGKYGGGNKYGGLLAVGGGLECGSDGNLGLAEANFRVAVSWSGVSS